MYFLITLAPLMLVVGLVFIARHYHRELNALRWKDARLLTELPTTRIGDIQSSGLVKIVGVATGPQTVVSFFDRVECLARRAVTREYLGTTRQGRVVQHHHRISHEWQLFPFRVDDGSGSIWIDPRGITIDYEIAHPEEDSSIQEHRIRNGDKVTVIGHVNAAQQGGYRNVDVPVSERVSFTAPPLVTWRSEPEFYPKLRPPVLPSILTFLSVGILVSAFAMGTSPLMIAILCAAPPLLVLFFGLPLARRMSF